ncbi:response regulator [Paenibacillus luteus]|uniref:response regulator n=1 Tax=Paenibacillus luteus TaxID=2545753 RepID=UPI001144DF4D|nr:response regulator [Paenibacillus luteus]
MLNLLIVDDEELIREEIKSKVIRISHPAIGRIELAGNAMEAMELLRDLKPGIVISDIRMPNMDGLSLIRECSQTNPEVKFIVLSGYGDYAYVREAFNYGIVDYLLKPVRLSDLELQLNKAVQLYKNGEAEKFSVPSVISPKDNIKQLLINLVNGNDLEQSLTNKLSTTYPEACWRISRFVYDYNDFRNFPSVDNIQETINNLINESGESMLINAVTLKADKEGGTIAFNHNDCVLTGHLKFILETLVKRLTQVSGARVMASISEPQLLLNLNEADKNAVQIISYRIMHEGSFVLDEEDTKGKEIQFPLNNKEIDVLMENIRMLNIEEVKQGVYDWFHVNRLKAIDTVAIRQMYLMILTELYRWHSERLPAHMIFRDDDFNRLHSLQEIRLYLLKQLNSIKQNTRQSSIRSKSAISIVKQYIDEHPYGDVTLAEVSNLISMNYTYFSSWFKMETGITFSAHITRQRMEKAKQLLEDPTIRINEVAPLVGYDNIYHFSRAFKNYTGFSPKEYRKSADNI